VDEFSAGMAPNGLVFGFASTRKQIAGCHGAMVELRPKLVDVDAFCAQIIRQQDAGYRLYAASHNGSVVGLIGYRELENTMYGRFLYVDDLVVSQAGRRFKLGATLLDHVADETKRRGCAHMVLDTGMANSLAQRFYFRWGMLARGLHFVWPSPT
jgi:ribosomal protein S18 acetylase RimI-like enzyme